jgi:hypothetical protein
MQYHKMFMDFLPYHEQFKNHETVHAMEAIPVLFYFISFYSIINMFYNCVIMAEPMAVLYIIRVFVYRSHT